MLKAELKEWENVLLKKLDKFKRRLCGRWINEKEKVFLTEKLPSESLSFLLEMMSNFPIIGQEFLLSEENDESGLGVEMEWMNPEEIVNETLLIYPGKVAHKYGYIGIGTCLLGSGDPYFLKPRGGNNYSIVRIPHNAVLSDENLNLSAVEIITSSLLAFFDKVQI